MLFFLGLVVRALARLLVSPCHDDGSKDLEVLVLRHELRILRRKAGPPKLQAIDRVLLAAASRAIPRDRWACFMVTPGDARPLAAGAREKEVAVRQDRSAGTVTGQSRGP